MKKFVPYLLAIVCCISILTISVSAFAAEDVILYFDEYDEEINNIFYTTPALIPHGTYILHAGNYVSEPFVYDIGDDVDVDDLVYFDIYIANSLYQGYLNVYGEAASGCRLTIWIIEDAEYTAPITEYLGISQSVYLEPYSPTPGPGGDSDPEGGVNMVNAIVEAIFAVFTAIANWFVEFVPSLTALFWTAGQDGNGGSLTFLGVLAILGLGVSVILMVVNLIRSYLNFG